MGVESELEQPVASSPKLERQTLSCEISEVQIELTLAEETPTTPSDGPEEAAQTFHRNLETLLKPEEAESPKIDSFRQGS